jgi:hypothetical protein
MHPQAAVAPATAAAPGPPAPRAPGAARFPAEHAAGAAGDLDPAPRMP